MHGKKRFIIVIAIIVLLTGMIVRKPITETWKSWGLPLSGRVIVIDPGHGGPDGGADAEGIQEKEITLKISLMLRDYLQEQGAIVIMIRETDTDLAPKNLKGLSKRKNEDLETRVNIANNSDTDLFISIHLNAMEDTRWHGAQIFYNGKDESNKRFAGLLQNELKSVLGNTERGIRENKDLFILRSIDVPGALAEVGFLSNDAERQELQNKKYQKKIAFALYGGISKFFAEAE